MSHGIEGSQFSFDFQFGQRRVEEAVVPFEKARIVETHVATASVVRLNDHRRAKHFEVVRNLLAQTGVFSVI